MQENEEKFLTLETMETGYLLNKENMTQVRMDKG